MVEVLASRRLDETEPLRSIWRALWRGWPLLLGRQRLGMQDESARGWGLDVRDHGGSGRVAVAAVVVDRELAGRGFTMSSVRLVHVLVMTKMRSALARRLVLAVRGRSPPGELQRQEHRKQQEEEPLHRAAIIAGRRR